MAVMLYVRIPLSLRNVEDLLQKRCIVIRNETAGSGGSDLGPCCCGDPSKPSWPIECIL